MKTSRHPSNLNNNPKTSSPLTWHSSHHVIAQMIDAGSIQTISPYAMKITLQDMSQQLKTYADQAITESNNTIR